MGNVEDFVNQLKDWCATYGYPVLFFGVLLENAGIPVPGETAVLIGGMLASRAGDYRFHLWTVILVVTVAAILGDNIGFFLGRKYARPRLTQNRRFLFLTPAAMKAAERYFAKYGVWTIFFARFVTGVRVVGGPAAGAAGMPWTHFILANAAGAVTWATAISLLGYYFGENLEYLRKILHGVGWGVLGSLVLLFIGYRFYRRWFARPANTNSSDPGPPPRDTAATSPTPDSAPPC